MGVECGIPGHPQLTDISCFKFDSIHMHLCVCAYYLHIRSYQVGIYVIYTYAYTFPAQPSDTAGPFVLLSTVCGAAVSLLNGLTDQQLVDLFVNTLKTLFPDLVSCFLLHTLYRDVKWRVQGDIPVNYVYYICLSDTSFCNC